MNTRNNTTGSSSTAPPPYCYVGNGGHPNSNSNSNTNTTHPETTHPFTASSTNTHPATVTATANDTSHLPDHGSASARAGENAAEKLKAGFNIVHGAGEGIRGNINGFLDGMGHAARGGGVEPETKTQGGEKPSGTVARGMDEFKKGLADLKR